MAETTANKTAEQKKADDAEAKRREDERAELADEYGRIPGDVTTEPVATAQQSARPGNNRVGPPTIAQDASAEHYVPEGVEQIEPGEEVSPVTPFISGRVDLPDVYDEHGFDVSEHKASADRVHKDDAQSDAKK